MIVTLITNEKLTSITLPEKKEGQYFLKDIITIEGSNDTWFLKSNSKIGIIDYSNGREEIKKIELIPMHIYHVQLKSTKEEMIIFTEPVTDDRQQYKKVVLEENSEITIGRNQSNDIIYSNLFASSKHAKIIYENGNYYLEDLGSTNCTFVNQERVDTIELDIGDTIFIMGLKIIIGIDFIAYNNPDGKVELNSDHFREFIPRKLKNFNLKEEDEEDDYFIEEEYFTRSPRFKREISEKTFNLANAPGAYQKDDTPAILTFGPSLTMGMGSMVSAVTSLATFQIPAAITSLGMLVGSLGFPTATRKYQEKLLKEKEELRKEKFNEYLNKMKEQIKEETDTQKVILEENFITTKECAKRIKNIDRSLWERTKDQNDFLKLRVGVGDTKLNANINYQKKEFDLDTDLLNQQVEELAASPKIIKDVPIIVSFYQAYMSGIIGDREKVINFAKGLILQLVTYYGYDEVKLVFLYDEEEKEYFEFTKWLPHSWNNEKKFRFIGTSDDDVKEISSYFDKEINKRLASNTENTPYYVIFALSKNLTLRSDIVKRLTSIKKNIDMSLITFYDELRFIPKECSIVIELNEEARILNKEDITGSCVHFYPDIMIEKDLTALSKKLLNIKLDLNATGDLYELPNVLTFLEMLKVGKVEHLNTLERWKKNDPTRSLKAPIGVNGYGNTFFLDLHEKFDGPHALVAGMTGSGKSELLITYILSLAINYHPNEVAFLLIDYKGGGMAKALEKLPHVAGVITNIDNTEINRILLSIKNEVVRRQVIFEEAREKNEMSYMTINKYQRLFREKKVTEPLPHLFIIADEFAELKQQQPDFMETIISVAHIGRSLGIHLILATQKPSGVVDDQIWSNARSKICLKVQDKSDSNDMLKRGDAAEIIETGRFYLEVGYNESFELGQSAWAGANYFPQDQVLIQKDNNIKVIDEIGQIIKEESIEVRSLFSSNNEKQIDAILKYIQKIALEENIHVRKLWQEPIPEEIYLEDINNIEIEEEIAPLIGEYDSPKTQSRNPLHIPLSKGGNLSICGISGSGKTMLLKTMIFSMIKDYKSDILGMYLLDFDEETLNIFEKASHVGDVVFSEEKEKVKNLFRMLQEEMEQRKQLLKEYNSEIEKYNKKNEKKLQYLFTIIHNFERFKELYIENDDELESILIRLTKEGIKYGIYFVITSQQSTNSIYKIGNNFKQQVALRQKENSDYSNIIEGARNIIPRECEGRGLIKLDDIYEFQTAHITKEEENEWIKEFIENLKDQTKTKKIPVLPNIVKIKEIEKDLTEELDKVPVGIDVLSLKTATYAFKKHDINMIFREKKETYNTFIKSLIYLYEKSNNYKPYIIDRENEWENEKSIRKYDDIKNVLIEVQKENLERFKKVNKIEENDNKLENIVLFINSISIIMDLVENDEDKDKEAKKALNALLNNVKKEYNITIIIIENSKNITNINHEDWYSKRYDNSNTIWLGREVDNYFIDLSIRQSQKIIDLKEEYGYIVQNGIPSRTKLINLEEEIK